MRIALAGLDSSRPVRVLEHLGDAPGLIALVTDGMPTTAAIRDRLPAGACMFEDLGELVGAVDVVLDFAHAAERRLPRLAPLLEAGIHMLADKPLTLRRTDAMALVDGARRNGAHLEADSGYRLAPTAEQRRRVARGAALEISGPADPHSPAGGLAFYGSHHAQILDELRPDAVDGDPDVVRDGADIVARIADVTLRFCGDPASGFALRIDGDTHPLAPPPRYLEHLIDAFLVRCGSRRPSVDERRLVRPIALVERITAHLPG
jgi:hypothetical protein